MNRYEYLVANNMTIEQLNGMGSLGWELVSVVNFPGARMERYYFKKLLKIK
jgi:hypothetical protein